MSLDDHRIATGIVYVASRGHLPPWAQGEPAVVLALFRGCRVEEAAAMLADDEHPAQALPRLLKLGGRVKPGFGFNFPKLVSAITGWEESRVRLALDVAAQAGMLTTSRPMVKA